MSTIYVTMYATSAPEVASCPDLTGNYNVTETAKTDCITTADGFLTVTSPMLPINRTMTSFPADLSTVAPMLTSASRVITPLPKPRPPPRQSWYVIKPNGSHVNETFCGRYDNPCDDLASVIARAKIHDVIYIDNGGDDDYVFDMCGEVTWDGLHHIEKPLYLRGYRSKPRLKCFYKKPPSSTSEGATDADDLDDDDHVTFTTVRHMTAADETCYVSIEDVIILDTVMSFSNCTVDMDHVTFYNASVVSWEPCHDVELLILHSDWYGSQSCNLDGVCINNFLNNLTCDYTTLKLKDDRFFQTSFIVNQPRITAGEARIYVADSLFSNVDNETQFLGGLHLTFWSNNSRIVVTNCTFRRLINPTRVQSVINLYDAAIWVKATAPPSRELVVPANPAIVLISDCLFYDNERGVTVVGIYRELVILRSVFEKNMAMHAGAGILVLIDPRDKNNTLYVTNCTFVGNVAGSYREKYPIREKEGAFELIGKEVLLNAECCKGVVMMVGKGGAIRAQRGQVQFSYCVFKNNRAKLLGGSIMVDIDGVIKIVHTSFSVDTKHEHALQGDIVYSDGKVTISHVTISIGRALNGLSVVRHSGNHWSLDVTNIFIECPVGYNLRATNSSAYGVHEHGLRRSFLLDQLSYFCESCPRNKYSLDHGFLNYTMVFNDFSYFTLLINGSQPEPQYTGKYVHHEIECDDCPYGGHCVHGITSVANFWGYNRQNKSVKFQHCPKGYCCSTTKCPSINSCVERRYGRLCGRCVEGYSEALFSSTCVPNETCGPFWLWPLGASIGLFYYLFLLFQTDLKNFLFSEPLTCGCFASSCCRTKKKKRSPFMNGNVAAAMRLAEGSECKFLSNGGEQEDKTPNGAQPEQIASSSCHAEDDEFKASDSGLLIIMFYYFQDALLLHVKTVYAASESKTQQLMKSILSGLFKLQLDLFELIEEVCTVPDMGAVPNIVSKAFLVPYVIIIFVTTYVIYKWTRLIGTQSCSAGQKRPPPGDDSAGKKSFITRLSSGFILALLFTYQKLGTTTFTLLNCVPVEDELVLFIDGTISCYQYWQYAVMAYALSCVVPFFVVLMVGPSLLYQGIISLPEFFLACLCPLFFLLPWTVKRLRRGRSRGQPRGRAIGEGTRAVIQVLQGPFKENRYGICWAGVLIGRRLILVLLFTFVNDSLIRLLGMLLTSFIILLHHVHVQPYKDLRGNVAGTMSATALVTLASINLVRAGFEAAEYTPSGPNEFLMEVFTQIENTLLLWLPFCVMCKVTILFLYRLIKAIFRCICNRAAQPEQSGSSPPHRGGHPQPDENSAHMAV